MPEVNDWYDILGEELFINVEAELAWNFVTDRATEADGLILAYRYGMEPYFSEDTGYFDIEAYSEAEMPLYVEAGNTVEEAGAEINALLTEAAESAKEWTEEMLKSIDALYEHIDKKERDDRSEL